MTILFLHIAQVGIKPTYLGKHGHTVVTPALPDDDFDEAVQIAQGECGRRQTEVVVGSRRDEAVRERKAGNNRPE